MIMRVLSFSRLAALLIVGLGFGVAPAAAGGCCYAAPVVVQPVVYYQSCSCCGCGSVYYSGGYAGYAYSSGYAYANDYVDVPRFYAPRRYFGARYWGPRRIFARY